MAASSASGSWQYLFAKTKQASASCTYVGRETEIEGGNKEKNDFTFGIRGGELSWIIKSIKRLVKTIKVGFLITYSNDPQRKLEKFSRLITLN